MSENIESIFFGNYIENSMAWNESAGPLFPNASVEWRDIVMQRSNLYFDKLSLPSFLFFSFFFFFFFFFCLFFRTWRNVSRNRNSFDTIFHFPFLLRRTMYALGSLIITNHTRKFYIHMSYAYAWFINDERLIRVPISENMETTTMFRLNCNNE